jgi:hypothetical protein
MNFSTAAAAFRSGPLGADKEGGTPAVTEDAEFPVSRIATDYYKNGPSFLARN